MHGIANLLSIPQLEEDGFTVNKSSQEWAIITPKGEKIVLKLGVGLCKGMPYIDLRESHGFAMIKTVRGNYEGFAKREVQRDIEAHQTQVMVAYPTNKSFKQMVSNKNLENSNIRVQDITNAQTIFGPNCAGLRGKTVRKKPTRVEMEYIDIPTDLFALHEYVTLVADIMFVNGFPLLIILSRDIRLYTAKYLPSRSAK